MQPHSKILTLLVLVLLHCDCDGCPPEINPLTLQPSALVVQYGHAVDVNCSSSLDIHSGMRWDTPYKDTTWEDDAFVTWNLNQLLDWDVRAECKIRLNDSYQCIQNLDVTVYQFPEAVFLYAVNHTTPVIEGTEYQLQCDIVNVAPVQNLTVTWYKGNDVLKEDSFNKSTKTPGSESSALTVILGREDNGAQFRCETQLHLGLEGPQRIVNSSQTLKIQVHYSPEFLLTDDIVEVSEGSDVSLNCSADGNPQPDFHWTSDSGDHVNDTTEGQWSTVYITGVTASTTYKCTAENKLGFISKVIHVIVNPLTESTSNTTTAAMTTLVEVTNFLVLSHPKVVVRYGASVSVNCSTPLADHDGMGWEATSGSVGLTTDVNYVTWTVDSLTDWTIQPMCYINANEVQHIVILQVVLYMIPDHIEISLLQNPSAGLMKEREEYIIRCDILNVAPVQRLTVTWYRGKEIIKEQSFNDTTKTPVNQSSILTITPKRSDNGTDYRCQAKLDLGPEGPQPPLSVTSEPLIAIVHYKPLLKECRGQFVAMEKSSMVPCIADGNPVPQIEWFHQGAPFDASVPLTRRDSGEYTLIATNDLGSTNTSIYITVEYIPSFACPGHFSGKENYNSDLNCTAVGNPVPQITWFKDEKVVTVPKVLKRNDMGHYNLTATNKHGTAHHILKIDIEYGPEFRLKSETKEVYKGSNVSLSCSAEGNPPPDIEWTYTNDQNERVSIGGRQNTILIRGATSTNNGIYICKATNKHGTATMSTKVTIRDNTIVIVYVVVALLLFIFIILILFLWHSRKKQGQYAFSPVNNDAINNSNKIPMSTIEKINNK